MAKLTDYLSDNYRGKETAPVVKPGPSIWEGLANLGSTVIDAQQGASQTRARRAAAERQASRDAQEASDLGAKNYLAAGAAKIAADGPLPSEAAVDEASTSFTTPEGGSQIGGKPVGGGPVGNELPLSDVDPAAAAAGAQAAGKAAGLRTAVEQGRMNETSYRMRLQQLIAEVFTLYPNSKAVVWEQFDKYSIQHPMFAEYKRASEGMDAVSKAEVEHDLEDARYYDENLNPLADDPNLSFEDKVFEGRRIRALHNANERVAKEQQRAQTNATFDQGQQDRQRTQSTQAWVTNYETYFTPKIEENNQLFMKIALDPSLSDADKFAKLTNAINANRSASYQILDYAKNQIMTTSKGNVDMKLLEESFNRMRAKVDEVLLPFDPKNPMNIVQRNATQMKMIQDQTGLSIEQASPILMELKRTIPNSETLQLMLEQTMQDPKIKDMLSYELRNFRGLGDPDSKVHLMNAINMIKSKNTNLRDLPASEGANALKNLQGFLVKALPQASRTKDAGLIEDSITGLGKVANVAVDLPIGTGYTTQATALNLLANNSSATVLLEGAKSSSNGQYANLVADGVRAAAQKGLINLRATSSGDPYWNIEYNKSQMKYELKPTGQKRSETRSGGSGFLKAEGGTTRRWTPEPSAHAKSQVTVMNDALQFMMKTGQFEDELPITKWTAPEQALFYATGQTPPGKSKEKDTGNLDVQISKVAHFWESYRVDWSKVNAVSFEEAAEARGIGARITGAENSTGNPAAKNPRSSATGNGQFIRSTWLETVRKHRPDLANGKSDSEILALRSDPNLSLEMTNRYGQDNAVKLRSAGLPDGDREISLAHFAGPEGAIRILRASPDTPIERLMSAKEIEANPFLRGKTASWVLKWAADRVA